MTDKFIKFIYQLNIEDAKIAVRTLKEPICFIKEGKEKQLTFFIIVIRLDNNSYTDIWVLVDSGYTESCIN